MGKAFIQSFFSGIAQIAFIESPLTGFIFLAGIAFFSPFSAGTCLLSTLAATLTAFLMKRDMAGIISGIYGFNGGLLGLALPVFLPHQPVLWILAGIGGVITAIAFHLLSLRMTVPVLTAPYLVTCWLFLKMIGIHPSDSIQPAISWWYTASLGIGQIFFINTLAGSLFIFLGIALQSLRDAAVMGAGALIGALPALWTHTSFAAAGLIGLNTSLVMVALLRFLPRTHYSYMVIAALAASVFTPFILQGFDSISLPVLTFPFVIFTWAAIALYPWFFRKSRKV